MTDLLYAIHSFIIREIVYQNIYFDTKISFLSLMVRKILAKNEIFSNHDGYHGNSGFSVLWDKNIFWGTHDFESRCPRDHKNIKRI